MPSTALIWCDNTSSIALASNPVFHARTKHVAVDYHFVRELVVAKSLNVYHVSTTFQIADIFTKGLSADRFHFLKSKLVRRPLMSLRGDDEANNDEANNPTSCPLIIPLAAVQPGQQKEYSH
ncbi:hypothetical protein FF1_010509 [Malus domestica]